MQVPSKKHAVRSARGIRADQDVGSEIVETFTVFLLLSNLTREPSRRGHSG